MRLASLNAKIGLVEGEMFWILGLAIGSAAVFVALALKVAGDI